jgi:hypothetical protein
VVLHLLWSGRLVADLWRVLDADTAAGTSVVFDGRVAQIAEFDGCTVTLRFADGD